MKKKRPTNNASAFPIIVCTVFIAAAVSTGKAIYSRQQEISNVSASVLTETDTSDQMLVLVNRTHRITEEYSGELVTLRNGKALIHEFIPNYRRCLTKCAARTSILS